MSDDGGALWLLTLGPAGGTALYWAIYRYYRNTDKSHAFERETKVDAKPVTGTQHKSSELTGVRESRIRGENGKAYRARVRRLDHGENGGIWGTSSMPATNRERSNE